MRARRSGRPPQGPDLPEGPPDDGAWQPPPAGDDDHGYAPPDEAAYDVRAGAHEDDTGAAGPTGTRPRRVRAAGRVAGRGATAAARGTGRAGRYTVRQARRAARAEGAGESGLSRLLETHAFGVAGDAAVAISLAGTLFFQVPTGEARGQVTLFLLLTMLPFAIVAPLIGPFLDRFSHGRRWAIGSTTAIRAFLCWVLAGAVTTDSTWLFPAALGVLVGSKAYGVTKAAAVPRLLPATLTLVKANGRVSLAGMLGAVVSAPIAALAATAGAEWSLRYAFVLFIVATILAILLPEQVDSTAGEEPLGLPAVQGSGGGAGAPGGPAADGRTSERRATMMRLLGVGAGFPGTVAYALRANCGPRWLTGFLIMFTAFLLRENPIGGYSTEMLLVFVGVAAGVGNGLGVALAALLRTVSPLVTVVVVLVADVAAALLATLFYGLLPLVVLGLVAGLSQQLAKLSLDSTIQRDVPDRVRTSAFARSDTMLQLAWVAGGFCGILMPLMPRLGFGVAAAVLAAWLAFVVANPPSRPPHGRARPAAR